jgi:hypothetical protein
VFDNAPIPRARFCFPRNNHTYDFGFTPAPVAATHSLGNYVWIDANNAGLVTVGEVAVPNGVVVDLLAADVRMDHLSKARVVGN